MSLLTGEPGFIQVVAPATVKINTSPILGDPLHENLRLQDEIGLLVVDLATRRRLRLNGKAKVQADKVIETTNASSLRWRFGEYSPFNPG